MDRGTDISIRAGNLEAVLEQVREDFVLRLRKQVVQLRALQQRMEMHIADDDLEVLEFTSHQICGLARTLGYAALGLASEQVEVAISSEDIRNDTPDVAMLLEDLLQEMVAVSSPSDI